MEINRPNILTDPDAFYQFRISAGELYGRNPYLLRITLCDIAKTLPALGGLIENEIDALLDAPPDQQKFILREITKVAASNFEFSAALRQHAESFALQFCADFVATFNKITGSEVLFVCGRPYFQKMREAQANTGNSLVHARYSRASRPSKPRPTCARFRRTYDLHVSTMTDMVRRGKSNRLRWGILSCRYRD